MATAHKNAVPCVFKVRSARNAFLLRRAGDLPAEKEIDNYILFFNEQRPAYSLNYLTPKQYRESFAAPSSV